MLRRISLAVIAAATLAIATNAQAQAADTSARPKIGLGVAIVPLDPAIGKTIELFVPLNLAPSLRIEPEVGILTSSNDNEDKSDFTIGVGVFGVQNLGANADMYFGGRLKLNFASVKPAGASSTSGTDLEILGALGGEYYLAPKFSIGVEGQLGYYSLSKVTGNGFTTTGFFTNGIGVMRLYFM